MNYKVKKEFLQMVKTFARSILLSKKERDYDEMLATRIVTFMMDNFDALFSPPESLAVLVHRKINEVRSTVAICNFFFIYIRLIIVVI